jgi:hypothetical protein
MLIGLTGKAFSGKDTVARFLAEDHSFLEKSLADPLRAGLREMLGLKPSDFSPENKETVIDWIGKSPRELLQTLGTEWGRDLVHPQVWVRYLAARLKKSLLSGESVVITDVRFVDEAELVHRDGGQIWRVVRRRSETTRLAQHRSEQESLRIVSDLLIENDGTLEELREKVSDAVSSQRAPHHGDYKDHDKRELVSRLTSLARDFSNTDQLRARIAGEVIPAIDSAVAAERRRWKEAMRMRHDFNGGCPDECNPDARDKECPACRALELIR